MVKRDVKGIAKVTAKGRTYWYAWRGGPRLRGEPGSAEFWASYNAAIADQAYPGAWALSLAGDALQGEPRLSEARTRDQGELGAVARSRRRVFRRLEHRRSSNALRRSRPVIRKWRNRYADRARTADVRLAGVDPCAVPMPSIRSACFTGNPCEGIKQLYKSNRSEIIWTDADIVTHQADMFGGDRTRHRSRRTFRSAHSVICCGLSWSHVGDDAIVIRTTKSGHKREAIVPLYDALKSVLADIPQRSTRCSPTGKRGHGATDSFSSTFNNAKHKAEMADANLHFHDLRGTAATQFYVAGLPERVIAEILGWTEESVAKIIRRYVDRSAAQGHHPAAQSRGKTNLTIVRLVLGEG